MSMSKKDFIALANVIRQTKPVVARDQNDTGYAYDAGRESMHGYMIETLADFCQSQNPNFKRDRWLDYIAGKVGPNGGAIK